MNLHSLILCEGKTDAIIIGYLMIGYYSWKHVNNLDKAIPKTIKVSDSQSFEWFQKDSNYAAVCGVGGKSCFTSFLNERIGPFQTAQAYNESFSKILIIRDRDNEEIKDIQDSLSISTDKFSLKFVKNTWIDNPCIDGFDRNYIVKTCLNIIPQDKEGALENVILDSISEVEEDKKIVDSCIDFVEENKEKAKKYLSRKRLVEKAKVGVTFAMMSPEKVFYFIDEILKSIDWSKRKTIVQAFSELKNI